MNSPFPGMDAFLEEPSGWTSVHHWLISVIGEMLIAQVALYYTVKIEERVYIADVDLRDPLPRITVPLYDPHPDVVLDLQAAFAIVYARARYADDVDYTRPVPPPPLRPADTAWVAQCIARWQAGRAELEP